MAGVNSGKAHRKRRDDVGSLELDDGEGEIDEVAEHRREGLGGRLLAGQGIER